MQVLFSLIVAKRFPFFVIFPARSIPPPSDTSATGGVGQTPPPAGDRQRWASVAKLMSDFQINSNCSFHKYLMNIKQEFQQKRCNRYLPLKIRDFKLRYEWSFSGKVIVKHCNSHE